MHIPSLQDLADLMLAGYMPDDEPDAEPEGEMTDEEWEAQIEATTCSVCGGYAGSCMHDND